MCAAVSGKACAPTSVSAPAVPGGGSASVSRLDGGGKEVRRVGVAVLMTGLLLLCAAVTLTLAAGVALRLRDGQMRTLRPERVGQGSSAPATSAPAGSASATSAPARHGAAQPFAGAGDLRAVLAGLGHAPGSRATLLQFSSAFCAPCRATRRILQEVSGMVEGVAHVEVDAEQHLDLVRRLRIWKTPTTLVLDAEVREVKRANGQPRKADVLAAIGQALP